MIPADHITIDGDIALVVSDRLIQMGVNDWALNDRPCDLCGGDGVQAGIGFRCSFCDGTGRHTFEMRAEQVDRWDGDAITSYRSLRVHVLDVLEMLATPSAHMDWPTHSFISANGYHWRHYENDIGHNWHNEGPVTLPPAAAPGQWLVRLAVHQ